MPKYYHIDEALAKRAKAAYSFYDYIPGSATAAYQKEVDRATEIAERQKHRVDPMYHDKIDGLLDSFARRLAENINKGNSITASCPSILIAGGSNFPVRKKEKQNARADANHGEYQEIQGLLDKIMSTGMGGISSDDPQALEKLRAKLAKLEKLQATMKAANAAIRLKDQGKGNAKLRELGFSEAQVLELRAPDVCGHVGFPSFELTNNNANIRRIKERIAQLEKEAARAAEDREDIRGEGYTLTENSEAGRIQFIFDGKPDLEIRELLKSYGFRWAPSMGAWQRLLNNNGRSAAQTVIKKMKEMEEKV